MVNPRREPDKTAFPHFTRSLRELLETAEREGNWNCERHLTRQADVSRVLWKKENGVTSC